MSWKKIEAILKRPFDDHEINWMPKSTSRDGGKVQLLAYMNARAVRDRLDEAFGPNWKTTYKPGPQGGVVCALSIKWNGEWIAREGGAENTQIEAVKGGLSDAEKRAATEWGIGRHLYDLGSTWVNLQDRADYSVPEGRRIYMKGKHAVAPSIRKLQPDLFNKKEEPKPKPVDAKQVAAGWKKVKESSRESLFYNHCVDKGIEPELADYIVCKVKNIESIKELNPTAIDGAIKWLVDLPADKMRAYKAEFLGEVER